MNFNIDRKIKIKHVLYTGSKYFKGAQEKISSLPVVSLENREPVFNMKKIYLPVGMKDVLPENIDFFPVFEKYCCGDTYEKVDWFSYAFSLLESEFERDFEKRKGSINSNFSHLKGIDSIFFKYAWLNRIFLLLRRFAAITEQKGEKELFEPIPKSNIILTHDIDSINRGRALRIKQGLLALKNGKNIKGFLKGNKDYYDELIYLIDLLDKKNIKSIFFVFATLLKDKKIARWFFDPDYSIRDEKRLIRILKQLLKKNHEIGLHASFFSSDGIIDLEASKKLLSDVLGAKISKVRQHWLRFSFENTWEAQYKASLSSDHTFGFNDLYGFRNSSCLRFTPYSFKKDEIDFSVFPMVLMDGQLFNHNSFDLAVAKKIIDALLNEIKEVGGTCTINWHPHTLSDDFKWKDAFLYLLKKI